VDDFEDVREQEAVDADSVETLALPLRAIIEGKNGGYEVPEILVFSVVLRCTDATVRLPGRTRKFLTADPQKRFPSPNIHRSKLSIKTLQKHYMGAFRTLSFSGPVTCAFRGFWGCKICQGN